MNLITESSYIFYYYMILKLIESRKNEFMIMQRLSIVTSDFTSLELKE